MLKVLVMRRGISVSDYFVQPSTSDLEMRVRTHTHTHSRLAVLLAHMTYAAPFRARRWLTGRE